MTENALHIAIVPDGNRRWSKERDVSSFVGHQKGFEKTIDIIEYATELGIKVITFFAFSTENWNRSKREVDYLMKLFNQFFDKYIDRLEALGCQFHHIGNYDRLTDETIKKIKKAEEQTKNCKKIIVQFALNYGGRDEIIRAVRKIAAEKIDPKKIDEEIINRHLDSAGIPDPDLIIRTSGEQRLSGFLLWQSAYSELYFSNKYWPDFSRKDLDSAISEYRSRHRRFGA